MQPHLAQLQRVIGSRLAFRLISIRAELVRLHLAAVEQQHDRENPHGYLRREAGKRNAPRIRRLSGARSAAVAARRRRLKAKKPRTWRGLRKFRAHEGPTPTF